MSIPSKKQQQISGLIQKEFSAVLQQEGGLIYGYRALVTVTRVRMSQDFGIAYIYFSIYNAEDKELVLKQLQNQQSKLRGVLGKRIAKQMRHIPELRFFTDETADEMQRVEELFQRIEAEDEAMRGKKTETSNEENQDEDTKA